MTYIDHPSFHKADAATTLFRVKVRRISADWYLPFLLGDTAFIADRGRLMSHLTRQGRKNGYRDSRLDNKIRVAPPRVEQPPWSREEEVTIFLQWNYSRRCAGLALPTWAERAKALEQQIIEANLGLVCSMVVKHIAIDGDRDDAISEGQTALMRAMNKFDVRLGNKFSTYACASIKRALIRRYQKGVKRINRFGCPYDERMDKPGPQRSVLAEDLAQLSAAIGKADLTEQEIAVIEMRFLEEPPMTLTDIGLRLQRANGQMGVTKEWVRQIEERALAKIRKIFDAG